MPHELAPEIALRLEAAKAAQQRTRFVFAITTVVCVSIICATYNVCFSWLRGFAYLGNWDGPPVTEQVQKKVIDEWVAMATIKNSLLGIHMSVSDAITLGSLEIIGARGYYANFWLREAAGAVVMLLTLIGCCKISQFEGATREIMGAYRATLES